jgi:hypothetical protein
MSHRRQLSDALDEIKRLGGVITRIEQRKHWRIFWSLHGSSLTQTVPVSGSCPFGARKSRADIRRAARSVSL